MKALLAITPNGVVSYVSEGFSGRCSDKFIVKSSGFLDMLRPGDGLMVDRAFKIKDSLAFRQCTLAIPPSSEADRQMSAEHVKKTSRVANARIYVEDAIGRVKNFRILKNKLSISLLPIFDDILITCCKLSNFAEPLCV